MWLALSLLAAAATLSAADAARFVVIVSANAEWRVVRGLDRKAAMERSPYGEFFRQEVSGEPVVVLQGGWGKIDAAASAQYAIDRWKPEAIFNLGTCGGMAGGVQRYDIVLAERTVVYDLLEMAGDSAEAIREYSTAIRSRVVGDQAGIRGAPRHAGLGRSRSGGRRYSEAATPVRRHRRGLGIRSHRARGLA